MQFEISYVVGLSITHQGCILDSKDPLLLMKWLAHSFLFLFLTWSGPIFSKGGAPLDQEKSEGKPLKVGNLSLSSSQQPGPLVGFGEFTLDKGETQFFFMADQFKIEKGYFIDANPMIVYGMTDELSILFSLPFAGRFKEQNSHSNGLEDAFVQLEYAFYQAEKSLSTDQATIVANVTIPTGSGNKNPPTGVGSPSIFIGGTFNRTTVDWFYFGSLGAMLTTEYDLGKFGNRYLYQGGIGRNLPSPRGWIFALMLEVDGQYNSKDRANGEKNPDSGGNVVFITPSLWISSEKIIIQIGVGGVLTQHLNGNQSKFTHQMLCNVGWTF